METTTLDLELYEEITEYERERGKPMPSFEHALAQRKTIILLDVFDNYLALPELSLKLSDNFAPTPDVAVYPKHFLSKLRSMNRTKVTIPPVLSIEILSPKQALGDLFEKAENFLKHGTSEAWVIVPEIKSITVFRPNQDPKTYITGEVHHESTGITINIEQLFSI
jgi:Uma2 family endonuclease